MPLDDSRRLSALRPRQTGTIQRVTAAGPELLRHLDELGLVPGVKIEVSEYSPFDHNITVRVGRKSVVLGVNITNKIFIEEG